MRIDLSSLKGDFPAGLVVFLVALPLCLGVALASGAPLFSGLVAGVVGGLVVGSLSKSQLSVSGPAAGLTMIVFEAIQRLGSFESFLFAGLLAGFIQVILGVIGAGSLGAFIPNAVIRGLLVSIGAILIFKQIPHAVGYGADLVVDETFSPLSPDGLFIEITNATQAISLGSTVICLTGLVILLIWEKMAKAKFKIAILVPGPLIVVGWGLLAEFCFRGSMLAISEQHMVSLPEHESFGHLLQSLRHPDFLQYKNWDVYVTAITIAVIASLETLLSIEAIEKLDPLKRSTPLNTELRAQGLGNIVSSLLGGLPVTSVIVRSSANLNAGASSNFSTIIHGLLLLTSVLFLAEWMNSIPLSALSSILLVTGYKLAKPSNFLEMYKRGFDQFVPFAITVVAILYDDLLKGVAIGTVVGLLFVVKSNFTSAITMKSRGTNYLIRFRKDVTFLNKKVLRETFEAIPPNSIVLVDATNAHFIDRDILDSLIDFNENARAVGTELHLRNLNGHSGPMKQDLFAS